MAAGTENSTDLLFGDFRLDRADERLWGPQGPVRVGNKAFRVLLKLAEQGGRLLTKDALFASVWDGTIVSESALTSVIKELRRALGDESKTPRYIESVYGRGYRLLPEVRCGADPAPVASFPAAPRPEMAAPSADAARLGDPPLLCIAPFDDAAIHGSQPHLAAVLREEILFALSRFRDIRLVSDVDRAGPGTGGYGERDYQLSVRLFHDGCAARAFARLSRLSSQAIIWADQIDLSDSDPGRNVERLVRRIASTALPRLHDDLLQNLPGNADDAYAVYFANRLRMRGLDSLEEAREVAAAWEELIERHPRFGQAYPPLIRLYNTDFCYTGLCSARDAERARAYELAHKAVALDPTDAHFHTVKGWCHIWAAEAAPAREHLEEALRLNPWNQNRLIEAATAFMFLADLDGAGRLLDRCRKLTPFASGAPHEEEGLLHLLRGEYHEAAERLALASRHHPDDGVVTTRTVIGDLYALLAAAGSGAPDLAERSQSWQEAVARRWRGPEPLDEERLTAWVLYQQPFHSSQRDWVLGLLRGALNPAAPARSRTRAPARRGTRSSPPPAGAALSAARPLPR